MNSSGTAHENEAIDKLKDLNINSKPINPSSTVMSAPNAGATAPPIQAAPSADQGSDRPVDASSQDRRTDTYSFDTQKMIGHGSFGAVFLSKIAETDEVVAIKKVLQDKRFKNRELQIMKQLARQPHPYIVNLRHHFVSRGSRTDDVYLNLVLEYVPETIYSIAKYFNRRKETMPIFSVKLYMYQLARALAHIHGIGICHRDIKPHNLLVNPVKQVLKLCDFGSAKAFVPGEPNVAYICSRFYRAPELIFGATDYTTAIDVWSQGCVFAELLIGSPLFPGSSGVDQLVEIIKILGTPTKEELKGMNPNYQEFKFPQIRAYPWGSIFKPGTSPEAVDLISKMLAYVPVKRVKAIESCLHPFFDELRQPGTTMPDRSPLPPELFQFTTEEMVLMPEALDQLLPAHIKQQQQQQQAQGAASSAAPAAPAAVATPAPIVAAPPSSLAAHPPSNGESTATHASGGV